MRTLLAALLTLLACPALAQQRVDEIPFESVPDFLKLPPDMNFGEVSAVAVNSKRHVFVLSRSNISGPAYGALAGQILEFDPSGKYIREIAKGVYNWSFGHGLRIDKDDNIWQVDKGSSTVTKLSPQGRVLMVFGRKGEASSTGSLAPDTRARRRAARARGRLFQPADGRGVGRRRQRLHQRRVRELARGEGGQERRLGEVLGIAGHGSGPVQHAAQRRRRSRGQRVRGRSRQRAHPGIRQRRHVPPSVQDRRPARPGARLPIGNTPATPATTGTNAPGSPFVVCVTPGATQYLFAADNWGRIFKMDLDGKVLGVMGMAGKLHGQFGQIHGMACPSENEIYVAEILNWRVQKLLLNPRRTTTNE